MVERASAGYDRSSYRLFSVNLENEEIEDALAKRNLFGWIDQIENPQLHKAVSSLSTEKKILLTLRSQKLCISDSRLSARANEKF